MGRLPTVTQSGSKRTRYRWPKKFNDVCAVSFNEMFTNRLVFREIQERIGSALHANGGHHPDEFSLISENTKCILKNKTVLTYVSPESEII